MIIFQLEDALETNMKELFHTEDCGLSLICRCCRGPVCEQRLTRADRMSVQRELWAQEARQRRHRSPQKHAERYLKKAFNCVISGLFTRVLRLF